MAQKLLKREFEAALSAETPLMVLDFYADWCGPCRMQEPQFRMAEAELAGRAEFFKVDIEDQPKLAARFNVMSIPTIVVVKGGTAKWRSVGVTGKDEIVAAVKKIL